ncbi:hypothetical protein [Heyndrickxia coagulans]|uniref:hypothetical protein n=1 Tax=Heyndrickxia coagulans TaxID=1398 RepID=UPI002E20680F|nr:hypothetical protein [Heyndrickxia coagulans]
MVLRLKGFKQFVMLSILILGLASISGFSEKSYAQTKQQNFSGKQIFQALFFQQGAAKKYIPDTWVRASAKIKIYP